MDQPDPAQSEQQSPDENRNNRAASKRPAWLSRLLFVFVWVAVVGWCMISKDLLEVLFVAQYRPLAATHEIKASGIILGGAISYFLLSQERGLSPRKNLLFTCILSLLFAWIALNASRWPMITPVNALQQVAEIAVWAVIVGFAGFGLVRKRVWVVWPARVILFFSLPILIYLSFMNHTQQLEGPIGNFFFPIGAGADKWVHMVISIPLTILFLLAGPNRRWPIRWLLIVGLGMLLVGPTVEIIQGLVGRGQEFYDVVAHALGTVLGVMNCIAILLISTSVKNNALDR